MEKFKAPLHLPHKGGEPQQQATSKKASHTGGGLEGAFTFLFVGRIVRDKGMNELMRAFQRLSKRCREARLVLVGDYEDDLDPISQEARDIIAQNGQIEAVGPKYGDELLACYAAADCFVFPSYREGFPNTVLEAGAMGLPCIVTDINGSREIVVNGNDNENDNENDNDNGNGNDNENDNENDNDNDNGNEDDNGNGNEKRRTKTKNEKVKVSVNVIVKKNGMVIPPRDEEALYEAMWRMMTDTEARERMAANARPMIAARFEQGFVRKCLYEFYDEIFELSRCSI